jgi:hypothetical protein
MEYGPSPFYPHHKLTATRTMTAVTASQWHIAPTTTRATTTTTVTETALTTVFPAGKRERAVLKAEVKAELDATGAAVMASSPTSSPTNSAKAP